MLQNNINVPATAYPCIWAQVNYELIKMLLFEIIKLLILFNNSKIWFFSIYLLI